MVGEALVRTARVAALVAAIGFALQTLLFLVAATGLMGRAPELVDTASPQEVDYATYYSALFNHQHDLVWNVVIRDLVGPVAWAAVGVLSVLTAMANRGPRAWVAALVVCVGAALAALADLVFATLVGFWRYDGWGTDVPADMIAAGRSYEAVKTVSTYLQYDGFLVVAVGFVVTASLARLRAVVRVLFRVVALALLGYVALDWSWPLWHDAQTPRDVIALGLGVVLAPALVLTWSRDLRDVAGRPLIGAQGGSSSGGTAQP